MGLLKDAFLSITMLLVGATAGTAASLPGEVVQAPLAAQANWSTLEPPHRDGADAAPAWVAPSAPPTPEPQVAEPVHTPPPAPDTLEAALARSPWPPYLWPQLIAVARCESSLNPLAVGDHGRALGLMQVRVDAHLDRIHKLLYTPEQLLELGPNLEVAYDIYKESGWKPWSCSYVLR